MANILPRQVTEHKESRIANDADLRRIQIEVEHSDESKDAGDENNQRDHDENQYADESQIEHSDLTQYYLTRDRERRQIKAPDRFGYDDDLCSRMNNVEKLHYGGTIIRDGGVPLLIMDQFVHAPWTKGSSHNISHSHARIYVADQLWFSLGRISPFFEQHTAADTRLVAKQWRKLRILVTSSITETDVLDEVRLLRERIDNDCPNPSMGWKVVSLLESLKALEKQESNFESQRSSNRLRVQEEVDELDSMWHCVRDGDDSNSFDQYLQDSNEKLELAKKELGAKLRSIVSLKRQLDEVPSQAELIQYELRLSELNTQIQKKHQQTSKHYDTYNALLEIKELMLKETSLLNSISLQFQNAITSADGRTKLINSLEGILKGTQQKLEKVRMTFESEQKSRDISKEKYAAAISEQRQRALLP
ncbi:hypothetical protein BUALT_Bualt10G0107000 [Buddleja alternifolia]|uniref:CCDC93 coiled-coil domain-containing protein n=1 Tax=Buddleja alternifolia TaxID=168488 RepID=A0AAV6X4A5_9LAMI|nr:hypothetical protein BUALT_Bualt10G0107000 [Buddleja alternifolia]